MKYISLLYQNSCEFYPGRQFFKQICLYFIVKCSSSSPLSYPKGKCKLTRLPWCLCPPALQLLNQLTQIYSQAIIFILHAPKSVKDGSGYTGTWFTDNCYKQVQKTFCGCKRLKYLHRYLSGLRKTMKSTSRYSWLRTLSAHLMIICFLMALFNCVCYTQNDSLMMNDMEGSTNGLFLWEI